MISFHRPLVRIAAANLFLLALTHCAPAPRTSLQQPNVLSDHWLLQDASVVKESGETISQLAYPHGGWMQAVVPGTVLTSLVANNIYPEPLYGENNRPDRIPESLARKSFWYREEFPVPALPFPGGHFWLNLDGINYTAEIWVNGHDAGTIHGAFSRGHFDITPYVSPNTTAAVAVHILPPPDPGNPAEQTQALGTGPNGGILAQDGPNFIASIGWDWIPAIRDRNIGIWQKVALESTGPIILQDPFVTSHLPLPKTDSADLTVSTTVTNVSDHAETGKLLGTIDAIHFQKKISLAPHESRLITFTPADTAQLHLRTPRLWWPNGYGDPNLYTLHLQFALHGAVSSTRDLSFGIREITYHVPGTDNLTVCVNGVPIICKGGDWGMDEAMKRIPRARLEAQIRLHQLANYTMIRNWVGQSTEEDFYDLCDRHGILIWDELFQPNPSDGPNPVDVNLYLSNVREKVLRFRSHPSIALWCGRNEGNPPANVDAGIQTIMHDLDPVRLYQKNSNDGKGVRSGGPYAWRAPRQYYTFPPTEAFKTEIGSVSIPTLQAIHAMMPEKDWWPLNNDDWAEHDLLKGAQQGDTYPRTLAARYGPCASLADFEREGQLANYEAFRAMYEGRFAKLFNPVTGVITWMSNPAQPSMVWQLYSHDLEPNASLFATRKACEPLHIMMNQANDHLMIINTTPVAQESLSIRTRIFNLDGTAAADDTRPASAPSLAATDAGPITFPDPLSPVHFLKLELLDSHGKVLSDNFYWRTTRLLSPATTTAPSATAASAPATYRPERRRPPQQPQEDFTDLQNLPPAQVSITTLRHDTAAKCLLTATLTNTGSSIALLTHVQLRNSVTQDRILPVYYSDNYITLLPGESRTIEIEAALTDVNSATPTLALDGWNIPRR